MKTESDTGWLLEARGICKSFSGVKVLDGVSLAIARGEVHALMGENGAGKSTLMKILMGEHQPDSGEIYFDGRKVRIKNPHQAHILGLAMIHQELMAFPELSVAENLALGRNPDGAWRQRFDWRSAHREARDWLQRAGFDLPTSARWNDLSVAQRQGVEIARALSMQARVLIMDEPTSALSSVEAESLFRVIRELKAKGVAVVYITHKLDEVFRIADMVTVLRDGRLVDRQPLSKVTPDSLIRQMTGRNIATDFAQGISHAGEILLEVRGLWRRGAFHDANLILRRGEIVGLAGLMGAGRTELASAIYGLQPADGGEIWIRGCLVRIDSPRTAMACGLAMVTEDRAQLGLVQTMNIEQNLTLSSLAKFCIGPFIGRGREREAARQSIVSLGVKPADPDRNVAGLSGGNQQKVVFGKALLTEPDILILDEPTRGIDVGAKAEIHELIRRLAASGKAVLLVSSEMPEVMSLCHRLLVMRQGRIVAERIPTQTTPEEILRLAMPGKEVAK